MDPKAEQGKKKPAISMIPGVAMAQMAQALQNGAEKYGAYNWRDQDIEINVYIDAMMRHLIAYKDGEDTAQDSGVHHIAHVLAGGAILLDALSLGKAIDNRPKVKGKTPEYVSGNPGQVIKVNQKEINNFLSKTVDKSKSLDHTYNMEITSSFSMCRTPGCSKCDEHKPKSKRGITKINEENTNCITLDENQALREFRNKTNKSKV